MQDPLLFIGLAPVFKTVGGREAAVEFTGKYS
jgi:hypothetical protein